MKLPGAGELKHRIAIRLWAEVSNDAMGSTPVYGAPLFVWAKIQPVGGALYLGSQQIENTITHRIIIRVGLDVTAQHVIEADGVRYQVKRVTGLGDGRTFMMIEVEEMGKVAP